MATWYIGVLETASTMSRCVRAPADWRNRMNAEASRTATWTAQNSWSERPPMYPATCSSGLRTSMSWTESAAQLHTLGAPTIRATTSMTSRTVTMAAASAMNGLHGPDFSDSGCVRALPHLGQNANPSDLDASHSGQSCIGSPQPMQNSYPASRLSSHLSQVMFTSAGGRRHRRAPPR